jgi:hypothetical protein
MNRILRDFIFVIIFTLFFLALFFLIQLFFFDKQSFNTHIEENYIDKTREEVDLNAVNKLEKERSQHILAEQIKKDSLQSEKIQSFLQKKQNEFKVQKKSLPKYQFVYSPENISGSIGEKVDGIRYFLETDFTQVFLQSLLINYYEKTNDVRWKMKNSAIHLFWVESISNKEMLSVFIHEFGHYIDIYSFEGDFSGIDKSKEFYDISWESTKILLAGQEQKDFVSGYAMTNKYEDFAESFVYYVLHNQSFETKSQKSEILRDKYEFFKNKVFRDDIFVGTRFSEDAVILDYYRDITKIDFNLTIFLQYLWKFI